MRTQLSRGVLAGVLAGLISGLAGAFFFAAMHAIIIVPIWDRLGSGPLFGALTGAAAGWALSEIFPGVLTGSAAQAASTGARFGATLWLLVTPVTAADALLRVLGVAPRLELVAVAVAVTLAIGSGAAYGWRRTQRKVGAISCAVATMVLTIAMAGPVPVGKSSRAFGIFLAVLPASVLGGLTLTLIARSLNTRFARTVRIVRSPILADDMVIRAFRDSDWTEWRRMSQMLDPLSGTAEHEAEMRATLPRPPTRCSTTMSASRPTSPAVTPR